MNKSLIILSLLLAPVAILAALIGLSREIDVVIILLAIASWTVMQWVKYKLITKATVPSWMYIALPISLGYSIVALSLTHPMIRVTHEFAVAFGMGAGGFIAWKRTNTVLTNYFFTGTIIFILIIFSHVAVENLLGRPLYYLHEMNKAFIYLAAVIMAIEGYLVVRFVKIQMYRSSQYKDLQSENLWFSSTFGLVSHNLKTPLANIQGQVDVIRLILERKGALTTEELTAKLDQIELSLTASKSTLEATIQNYKSLITTLNQSERTLGYLMEELAVKYEGLEYSFDSQDLRSVPLSTQGFFVFNLNLEVYIDNAIKYAGHMPEIRVLNRRIQIVDKGPGFSDELINKLGGSVVASRGGGNGLGMFLAISLLRSVEWDLSIQNTHPGCVLEIHELKA